MRISQIEVEGVQSYRAKTVVYIEGHPLLAAVGPTGAGKSTIVVDAMLYAFWAKVRTRTVEEMISLGAPLATVSINFYVGEALYRVTRTTPRAGKAEGCVYAADDLEPSGWRPLTERGMKEVTEKVTELIGMTYEMATQTWVAEQGQYGKFASSQPRDRFALLANVFNLDGYGTLAKKAKENLAAIETKLTGVSGQMAEVEAEQAQLSKAATDSPLSSETDETLAASRVALGSEEDAIRTSLAGLNAGDPAARAEQAKRTLDALVSGRASAQEAARAELARAEQDLVQAVARRNQDVASASSAGERRASEARTRAEGAKTAAQGRVDQAEASLATANQTEQMLPGKIVERDALVAAADEAAEAALAADRGAAEATTLHATLRTEHQSLDKMLADASKRVETLRLSLADADHASCFSCGQHLSPEDAQALMESQGRDIAGWNSRQAACQSEGMAAQANARRLAGEAGASRARERELRAQVADLNQRLARGEEIVSTKPERESHLRSAQAALDAAGAGLDAELSAIAAEVVTATEAADAAFDAAKSQSEVRSTSAQAAVTASAEPSEKEAAAQKEHADLLALAQDAEVALGGQRAELTSTLRACQAKLREVEQEEASRAANIARLAATEARLAALAAERSQIDHDRRYLSVLAKAYASSGIPAMILATITEELNEAINVSLEHLSRGELSVMLMAARDTRAGTTENKITVYVDTPEGPRAYESFSGGQKFRVDLAIRTGLTRVITRRTGTPIETFILDEGWGTLDEGGITAAVDTLQRLSVDFNVLTVSHIEAVRDAFPARIMVQRNTGTSIAEVMAA